MAAWGRLIDGLRSEQAAIGLVYGAVAVVLVSAAYAVSQQSGRVVPLGPGQIEAALKDADTSVLWLSVASGEPQETTAVIDRHFAARTAWVEGDTVRLAVAVEAAALKPALRQARSMMMRALAASDTEDAVVEAELWRHREDASVEVTKVTDGNFVRLAEPPPEAQ